MVNVINVAVGRIFRIAAYSNLETTFVKRRRRDVSGVSTKIKSNCTTGTYAQRISGRSERTLLWNYDRNELTIRKLGKANPGCKAVALAIVLTSGKELKHRGSIFNLGIWPRHVNSVIQLVLASIYSFRGAAEPARHSTC